MASVPHGYMLGAFTFGKIAARTAVDRLGDAETIPPDRDQIESERERLVVFMDGSEGIPPHQAEYKLRRLVNDYLQPPKSAHRLERGLESFREFRNDIAAMRASDPHEWMRAIEVTFIRDCAEMAAVASLFRTESRWGLYHYRQDFPEMDEARWFVHVNLRRAADGGVEAFRRAVEPYVVPLGEDEIRSYQKLRVSGEAVLS
jgi:succinate dehydrogenase/fumarate reductase flavoprotein subunit